MYSLAVALAYLALLERPRMMGLLTTWTGVFLLWFLSPGNEALRPEVVEDSALRLEKPVRVGAAADASVSLGVVLKELVRLRGSANMSRRDSGRFASGAGRAVVPSSLALFEVLSVSGPSLSEASPRRARRSMEARVGRGAVRE